MSKENVRAWIAIAIVIGFIILISQLDSGSNTGNFQTTRHEGHIVRP